MTDIDLNEYRRIYLTLSDNKDGRIRLRASHSRPPRGAYMIALMSAGMTIAPNMTVMLVSDPTKDPALRGPAGKDGTNGRDGINGTNGTNGKDGAPGTVMIGTVEIVDRALVALALGLRTLTVACPGATVGQIIRADPTSAMPTGYAVHNAWVTAKDQIAIRFTGPALALGASNTLALAVSRMA